MLLETFDGCAGAAERLIGSEPVASRWSDDSALQGYSVAGLAGHLARAVLTVEQYLDADAPTADGELTDAAGYFVAVLGADDPIDSDLHRRIRARGAETASEGPQALAAALGQARGRLRARLDALVLQQVVEVRGGVTLTLAEYLETRLVELVIHLDDLAVSAGQSEPESIPDHAYELTAVVLARLAARRADGLATVRSLARRERQPDAVRAL